MANHVQLVWICDEHERRMRQMLRSEVELVLARARGRGLRIRNRFMFFKGITAFAGFVLVLLTLGIGGVNAQQTQQADIAVLQTNVTTLQSQVTDLQKSNQDLRDSVQMMRGITIGVGGFIGLLEALQLMGIGLRRASK
jgi:hypothetical protein